MWLRERVRQELVCAEMMKSKNSISVIYSFCELLPEMTCKLFKDSMWQEPFPAYLQGAHAPISEMHPLETTVAVNL